jgi:hypothetical protein
MTEKRPAGRSAPEADKEFISSLRDRLRKEIRADGTFESRVMSAIRESPAERAGTSQRDRGWWRTSRSVRYTPLSAVALAASLFAAAVLGVRWLPAPAPQQASAVAIPTNSVDTVHVVRFVFVDEEAQSVSLVGDFNAWTRGAMPLERTGRGGAWTIAVPLSPGRYEYAFIVRGATGDRWIADPFAATIRDDHATESSIVFVGNREVPSYRGS